MYPIRFIKKIIHLIMRHTPGGFIRIKLLKLLGANITGNVKISQDFFVFDGGNTNYLTIEDKVGIGPNVTIVIHSDPSPSPLEKIYPKSSLPVNIKEGVWVGAGAIVLPGVTIGEYSVIAAGAVVTKDVPPYTVVAGVPGKVVKTINKSLLR
ncbi:acyltransferase [Methanolobus sp. ZRKC3]|uniref:acyltransferase n=1 Tax=Methanolobus sp. ZRKC3 TaxID=3125786 RepID=UPI00324C49A8